MALLLNGTTGYLQYPNKIVSAFPYSMVIVTSGTSYSGLQVWLSQTESSVDRGVYASLDANGTSVYATIRNPGNSLNATDTTAPYPSPTALNICVVVFASTTSQTVYYGSSTAYTASNTVTDDTSLHNLVTVGALQWNGGSAAAFTNGSVEEAHFYNVALSSANVASMISGTLPETLTGWVDGWTLRTYSAGGTYTSIGGTRTLTAYGGVSASGLTSYFTRSSPATLSSPTGSGTGTTTATVGATTDTASGTMYAVVTVNSGTPTAAQIEAGKDSTGAAGAYSSSATISATGAHTFSATGLTASTTYYAYFVQTSAGGTSNIVGSASFTTSSGGGGFVFTGTVPSQSGTVGTVFSWSGPALSSYFSGGTTPYSYAVYSGTLPTGLSINASTGVISGTPSAAGSASIVVRGTDSEGSPATANTNSFAFTISVSGSTVTVGPLFNNTLAAPWALQAVKWSWLPAGRIGSLSAVTSIDGSGTTDSSGNLVIPYSAPGIALVSIQQTSQITDYVFYEGF